MAVDDGTLRIGLIGPSEGNAAQLREAAEFLLSECEVDQAVYLGNDSVANEVAQAWGQELMGGDPSEQAFLDAASRVALGGDSQEIRALLERDALRRRLHALRHVPPPPTRAVEVLDDRVLLLVHDKASLTEEDIVNAHLIVYGRAKVAALHRFGPRAFYTPGCLAHATVAIIERQPDGVLGLSQYNPNTGEPRGDATLIAPGARLVVQS